MRVLLADDHTLVRAGIRSLLETIPGVDVVAEAGDGREALELIARHRPRIALLDINMPGLNGLDVATRAAAVSPDTRVLVLSMHASRAYVTQALRAGVAGYLLKDAAAAELGDALRAVGRGESYLSPAVSRQLDEASRDVEAAPAGALERLTPRQREILQLIAEGRSTREIAGLLDVSVKTVETHRAQLMHRVGIHEVAGLVRLAIREGLISPER